MCKSYYVSTQAFHYVTTEIKIKPIVVQQGSLKKLYKDLVTEFTESAPMLTFIKNVNPFWCIFLVACLEDFIKTNSQFFMLVSYFMQPV